MSDHHQATDNLVYIDPASQFEIRGLPTHDELAAGLILGPATDEGTGAAGLRQIAELREDSQAGILGGYLDGDLVGVYAIQRDGMANTIAIIAVRADRRRRGIGKAMLTDALYRSGKRPLTVETTEEALPFFTACGFKKVGRRTQPSGAVRYRLGWHAPGASFKGGTTGAAEHQPIAPGPAGPDDPS